MVTVWIEFFLSFIVLWLTLLLPAALLWKLFYRQIFLIIRMDQLIASTLIISAGYSLWSLASNYHQLKQTQLMNSFAKVTPHNEQTTPTQTTNSALTEDMQAFLQALDQGLQNPDANQNHIQTLRTQFNQAFQTATQRKQYEDNIILFHQCQIHFLSEIIESLKTSKVSTTQAGIDCRRANGELFGRERLVPEEVVANFDRLAQAAAAKEKISQPDGSQAEINEALLEQAKKMEERKLQFLKQIFSN